MTVEEVRQQIASLESVFRRVQEEVPLNGLRDEIARLDRDILDLPQRIAKVRSRGYAFDRTLESQAEALASRWEEARVEAKREAGRLANLLQMKASAVGERVVSLGQRTGVSASEVAGVRSRVDDLEREIDAAKESVRALYRSVQDAYQDVETRLRKVEWMQDQLDEASFTLLEGESGIMAAKAVWVRDGKEERKDDPEGILYLTDQRILFERKEEVVTKKVLFVATEKKLVQEMQFETPVVLVEDVQDSRRGFMKKDDYLEIAFAPGAPQSRMTFHIWGSGDAWQKAIKRAREKGFDEDRAIPVDEEAVEKVRQAPDKCPSCGATIQQVVLRGQDTLTCEYCGQVIRL